MSIALLDRRALSGTGVSESHNKDFLDKIDAMIANLNALSGGDATIDITDVVGLTAALAAKLESPIAQSDVTDLVTALSDLTTAVGLRALSADAALAANTDDAGIIPSALFAPANNPSDADTLTYGSTVFEFDNNAAITGDVTVTIGGTLGATMIALADAINASSETVVATAVGDTCEILLADAAGGTPIVGAFDATFERSESGDVLNIVDGHTAQTLRVAGKTIMIDAALAAAPFNIDLPFTIGQFNAVVIRSGAKIACTATYDFGGSQLEITPTSGATAMADGDVLVLNFVEARS